MYEPKPGDIGITTISGWGGFGIHLGQLALGCGWKARQHAFVVSEIRDDGPWIVEAMPGGARHVADWHDPARTVYLRCPDAFRTGVAAAARGYVGVPYSWLDYDALAAHRLHIPYPQLKTYIKASHHMICSQLADQAAADGGWHLFKDERWPGDVSPCALEQLYRQQEKARVKGDGEVSR